MGSGTADWRAYDPAFHIRVIFGLIVVLLWTAMLIGARSEILQEADLHWHIKTGEWIWLNAAVPRVDPFSHTYAGEPWIAKEWLSQVLFFGAYAAAEWTGVMLVSQLAFVASAGVFYLLLSRDLAPIPAAIACIGGLLLASQTFTVRPHLLTLLPLIVWTYQLFAAARRHQPPHFALLLLLVLWANLHAAFTIGFIVAAFAFLDVLERTRLARKDVVLKWIVFLVLCPLVTLIHPYFHQAILATWSVVGTNEAVPLISEWQPFNAQTQTVIYAGLLLLLIFLALVSGLRLGVAKALLILLLLYLFLNHMRYAFYLFPVLMILLAPEVAQQFPRMSAEDWRRQPRDVVEAAASKFFRPVTIVLGATVVLLALLQSFLLHTAPSEDATAASAIRYAKEQGMTGNVMNHYNYGGPLILQGIPTFLDGRTDQLFLDGFVGKFAHGPGTADEMAEALKQYDVSWTLFPREDSRVGLLDEMPGWRRVYDDSFAVIHQRDAAGAP